MIKMAEDENTTLTWILRLVGFGVMAFGIYLIFKPIVVFADVIPFLGSLVSVAVAIGAGLAALCLSLITIAIGWVFYRPLIGIAILVVAGLAFGGLAFLVVLLMKGKRNAANR